MTYGMVPYLITAIWFMNRVGDREYLKALFRALSPYYWASLGMYVCLAASVSGAAWCALPLFPFACCLPRATSKVHHRGVNQRLVAHACFEIVDRSVLLGLIRQCMLEVTVLPGVSGGCQLVNDALTCVKSDCSMCVVYREHVVYRHDCMRSFSLNTCSIVA
jgi:hypothetical protein